MASEPRPPGQPGADNPSDDRSDEVDDLFDELFEEEPKTDPVVPALADEVTLEIPGESGVAEDPPQVEGEPLAPFAPFLPEMAAEIWQAGIQALVNVPDTAAPSPPAPEERLAEARLFRSEGMIAETPELACRFLVAAARAAESGGDLTEAAGAYDEALERVPGAADALRGRARLAESLGDIDEAHALWARLAVAAETPDERAFYGGLSAEWTLARRGALPAVALDAIEPGPARALALVEEALRGGDAGRVAVELAAAGRALGGTPGAALLEEAARFATVARDAISASAHRVAARQLDPDADGAVWARLRDAARMDARGAAKTLSELLSWPSVPPGSALAHAIGRWAAGLARRRDDRAGAAAIFAELGTKTVAAARDRLDFDLASGAALDEASLARLRAAATTAVATANLDWLEAGDLLRRGEEAAAGLLLARGLEALPDAVPLGLLAEELAAITADPARRVAALDGWLRSDPARRAEAALALAEARDSDGAGHLFAARAALQTAVEAAPGSALFWTVAAADARSGRRQDAAATLDYGADIWAASALGTGLRACAASKIGLGDPARALSALVAPAEGLSEVGRALGPVAVARLAARAADPEALRAALDAATRDSPMRLADLAVERASSFPLDGGRARSQALAEGLAAVPDHPLALPLYLLEPGLDSTTAATALAAAAAGAAAGVAAERFSTAHRLLSLAAGSVLALEDDGEAAFLRAAELVAARPEDRSARVALVRAATRLPAGARRRAVAELPVDTTGPTAQRDEASLLIVAEALLEVGDSERAAQALAALAGGRFEAEARRASVRLGTGAAGLPPGLGSGPADQAVDRARAALASTTELARAGRWDELLSAVERTPPHERRPGASTLAFLALVAEGRDLRAASDQRLAAAVEAAGSGETGADALGLLELARVAESEGDMDMGLRRRAYQLTVGRFGVAESGRRAAAFAHAGWARLEETIGAAGEAMAQWSAALTAEPTFLPAALALRRGAARRGDEAAAAAASETEAGCLLVPGHRVRALLLAAALISESRGADPAATEASDRRALDLLRAALAIDPTHEGAFERLRELLARLHDTGALSAALAARIEVAQNPFEVTSLRLARADHLAGPLADVPGARLELEAILRKQPEHPRALAKLSDLLWEGHAWGEAGEVYLKRAVVERDPGTLREIFLRLGQIYSERVPDAKRAAMAYERVLSVDPENTQALGALSDLYLAEGEIKLALPVTDRLVARQTDPLRRTVLRVRLGEILMQTGDMRRAGTELRRAVDEAPRDVAAVGALAQFLDRARDQAGRRTVLDRAVGFLRHDLEGNHPTGLVPGTLRALASLLTLRERPHAALAAAQLFAAIDAQGAAARAAVTRPGRSLAALRQPELDDRSFPQDLPPGIRQILRLVGPALRPSGPELAQRLARYGVTRADRKPRGVPPRPAFESLAAELRVGDFDLYVKVRAAAAGPIPLRAEPGSPPAIILGAPLVELGPAAVRFSAARALRLTATHLDTLLALPVEEAGALLVAIIRQFVPDYRHAEVRDGLVDAEAARVDRLIPRKLKQQVLPFAVESAGAFDLAALYAAVRDGANAAGLLAAADLPAALSVVLALSGSVTAPSAWEPGLTLAAIGANPEALSLLRFALSDGYDDLARALEA